MFLEELAIFQNTSEQLLKKVKNIGTFLSLRFWPQDQLWRTGDGTASHSQYSSQLCIFQPLGAADMYIYAAFSENFSLGKFLIGSFSVGVFRYDSLHARLNSHY